MSQALLRRGNSERTVAVKKITNGHYGKEQRRIKKNGILSGKATEDRADFVIFCFICVRILLFF